ncbi:MAG: hypothetical protein C0621_05895 [Desulfuromonas sp.]|nr:MAG: hypothetical protein C0621_05895 [Desulfuromonas sp.]
MSSPQLLTSLCLTAFAVNLPLGYLRQGVRKFSAAWFLYIHLSIPLIICLRLHFGFSWSVVPLTLLSAVGGQIAGGRWRRRK